MNYREFFVNEYKICQNTCKYVCNRVLLKQNKCIYRRCALWVIVAEVPVEILVEAIIAVAILAQIHTVAIIIEILVTLVQIHMVAIIIVIPAIQVKIHMVAIITEILVIAVQIHMAVIIIATQDTLVPIHMEDPTIVEAESDGIRQFNFCNI